MNPIMFYLGALGLLILGSLLIQNSTTYSTAGGTKFERRMKRKMAGVLFLIAAGLLIGLAVLSQFYSSIR